MNPKEKIKLLMQILLKVILYLGFLILLYGGLVFLFKNITEILVKNILDYIKVLIWPIVVLTIALTFREKIADLIERLEELEVPGFVKGKTHPFTQQEDVGIIPKEKENEDFKKLVSEKEEAIKALKGSNQDLIEKLTRSEVEIDFERIYNVIFANQIELLNQIINLGGSVSYDFVVNHYEKVQKTFPTLNNWDTTKYLNFLITVKLVEFSSLSGGVISVIVTSKGKAFLAYLTSRNYKKLGL
ncbi:MAG: hypothetical protein WAW15_00945 [Minisyncoccales bacterium]